MEPGRHIHHDLELNNLPSPIPHPFSHPNQLQPPNSTTDRPAMPLRHIHLPSSSPSLFPPYRLASRLQHHLRRRLLDFKDSPTSPPPLPTLLTFTPPPTYTLGRRQSSPAEINIPRLLAPLSLPSGTPLPNPTLIPSSPRGGLATYHGPGQIVLWPVLDLKSASHAQFTVRCWARALEETTMAVVRGFGVERVVVEGENPGVWVQDADGGEMRKIAALGVHLRRFVTGLGVAVNVDMPVGEGEGVDPWGRFVACGIEGRGVTSVRGEGGRVVGEDEVAGMWAGELARRIGVEGVEGVGREEVMGLLEGVVEGEEGEEGPVGREEREYVDALGRGEV